LLNDVSSGSRCALAHFSGYLIVFMPSLILFAGFIATASIMPEPPFDVGNINLVFIEKSPQFRSFLLDSLPWWILLFAVFLISGLIHIYAVLPWLLRTTQSETSESLQSAKSLFLRESSDSLHSIIEAPTIRLRIERSVEILRQSVNAEDYSAPLSRAVSTFGITWMIVGPTDGSLRFHEVAAGLIPALMIALMLNTGAIKGGTMPWSVRFTAILAFLTLAGGEAAALSSLLNSQPQYADITLAAIAAGFTGAAEAALARSASAS